MLHALLNGIIGIDDLTREVVEDHFMATKNFYNSGYARFLLTLALEFG